MAKGSGLRAAAALVTISHQPSALAGLQSSKPIIVKIIEPPGEMAGLADVLIGALGLTGLFVLGALVLAVAFAGVLFWYRSGTVLDLTDARSTSPSSVTSGTSESR